MFSVGPRLKIAVGGRGEGGGGGEGGGEGGSGGRGGEGGGSPQKTGRLPPGVTGPN